MKATELRIGNKVLHKKKEFDVVSEHIWLCEKEVHDYEPIPLTEEWLLKAGFTENDGDWYFESDNKVFNFRINLHQNNSNQTDIFLWNFHDELVAVLDGNVHTLQNLFFSITRHELSF